MGETQRREGNDSRGTVEQVVATPPLQREGDRESDGASTVGSENSCQYIM